MGVSVKMNFPKESRVVINGYTPAIVLKFTDDCCVVEVHLALKAAIELKDALEKLLLPWVREALCK